jgi:hypothetical protein
MLSATDVDADFLAGQLRELVAELVHLGPLLSDDDAGTAGVDRDHHLAGLAVDLNVGDRGVAESRLQIRPQQLVFLEQSREVLLREPARAPVLGDPETESGRMYFLSHYLLPRVFASLAATTIST